MTYSPDSRLLAAGGDDRIVRVYNAETGELLSSSRAHDRFITCMAFSPDGKLIATGSGDRTVKLWDVDALIARKP